MFKNVASQKLRVFVFDSTTNLPKTGDASNLTAYVSKDYGAVTVLADTTATEEDSTNAKGYYLFDLAQAETNGDYLGFTCKSATANMVCICCPDVVYTLPANFTTFSVDGSGRVVTSAGTITLTTTTTNLTNNTPTAGTMTISGGADVTKWNGTTVATPDTAGYPKVTHKSGTGAGEISLSSGLVTTSAGTITLTTTTTNLTNNTPTAGTITLTTTTTNLTNLPSIPANWLTSAGIAASALNGKGDWLLSSSYTAPPSAATIGGAVWDITISSHLTSGTTGAALNAAGSAGDPWSTALPGAYGSGTAGNIIGNNLNATVSSRMATYTQPTGFLAATFPTTIASPGDAMALTSGERTTLAAAIWNALTSGLTTAGSIGKRLVDFVTTLVYAAAPTAAQNRAEMDANSTKLANLDVAVSTRAPAGDFTSSLDSFTSCKMWLRKNVGYTAINGLLSQWDDQSGHANHVTQPTVANRPLVSGEDIVLPTGIVGEQRRLVIPSGVPYDANAFSIFFVVDFASIYGNYVYPPTNNQVLASLGANLGNLFLANGLLSWYDGNLISLDAPRVPHGPKVFVGIIGDATNSYWVIEQAVVAIGGAFTAASGTGGLLLDYPNNEPMNGIVHSVAYFDAALTAEQARQVRAIMLQDCGGTTDAPQVNIVFDGDSLTGGIGSSDMKGYVRQLNFPPQTTFYNNAYNGQTLSSINSNAATRTDAAFNPAAAVNLAILWAGTNDIALNSLTPAQVLAEMQTYYTARKAAGWTVLALTMIPRTSGLSEPTRATMNSLIAANKATVCDYLVDVAAIPAIGASGAENDLTYFFTDHIHLNSNGYAVVASAVQDAIDTAIEDVTSTIVATLAGITSLPNWLRAMTRSDAPDSVALAEINNGVGTFASTASSLQAISALATTGGAPTASANAAATAALLSTDHGTGSWYTGTTALPYMIEGTGSTSRWTAAALALAPTGGSITVALTVTPLSAVVDRGSVVAESFVMYQNSSRAVTFGIIDTNGQPVDLTNKHVRFTASDRDDLDHPLITYDNFGTGGLSVSTSNVTVTIGANKTTVVRTLSYGIWNVTDNVPVAQGTMKILPISQVLP